MPRTPPSCLSGLWQFTILPKIQDFGYGTFRGFRPFADFLFIHMGRGILGSAAWCVYGGGYKCGRGEGTPGVTQFGQSRLVSLCSFVDKVMVSSRVGFIIPSPGTDRVAVLLAVVVLQSAPCMYCTYRDRYSAMYLVPCVSVLHTHTHTHTLTRY